MFKSRKFYYFLFVFGAVYVLLIQLFFKNEGRFIIQAPSYSNEIPYSFKSNFQELNIPINQNVSLHGIWFKHETPKAIILFFPDSDQDLRELNMDQSPFYTSGFDVLIMAYRGSAQSTSEAESEADFFSDAQNWYNFAKSQFPENKIILAGQGFGATIAAQLAGTEPTQTLILIAPRFAYGEYNAKSRFWFLPYNYFTAFPLKTWEYARKTKSNIIVVQTEETKQDIENLIPYLKLGYGFFIMDHSETLPPAFKARLEKILEKMSLPEASEQIDSPQILKIK